MRFKRLLIGGMLVVFAASASAQEASAQKIVSSYATPQDSIEYREQVEIMLDVSGGKLAAEAMIPLVKGMLQSKIADASARERAEKLFDEFFGGFVEDALDIFAPLYLKFYTIDDLKELNQFYRSPIGQKFASTAPGLSVEVMKVTQEYAVSKMKQLTERLKEEDVINEDRE